MKCIEDEIPFDLPDGWAWCRLRDIITVCSSKRVMQSEWTKSGVPFYRAREIVKLSKNGFVNNDLFISEEHYQRLKNSYDVPRAGDLMVTGVGTIGKAYIVKDTDRFYYKDASVLCFENRTGAIISDFAKMMIESDLLQEQIHSKTYGNTVDTITITTAENYICVLPPLEEQQQIISTLISVIEIIDEIENDRCNLLDTVKSLKSKILDLAIRGQLVPQDPADEPASVLLDRIRAEKEELIKQGKIKRDKKESVISKGEDNSYYEKIGSETVCIDDLLPFEIPETWSWVRMKEVCIINPRNNVPDDTEVSFIPMPLIQEGFANAHSSKNKTWAQVKSGFTHFRENDVGVAKITPCFENRKSVVFHNLKNGIGAGTTELHILRPVNGVVLPEYILAILKTGSFIAGGVQTFSSAVGQQRISKDYVAEYLVPLPPFGEQQRICDRVVQVLDMLSSIEASLS